jgi:hypothetical protein
VIIVLGAHYVFDTPEVIVTSKRVGSRVGVGERDRVRSLADRVCRSDTVFLHCLEKGYELIRRKSIRESDICHCEHSPHS